MRPVLCIVTGTRAEYGLLSPLIDRLAMGGRVDVRLLVTGAHLSMSHGLTVTEIEADEREILERVPVPLDDDTEVGIAIATAAVLDGCARAFGLHRPGAVLVLGDRYESFAASTAAYLERIPIVHLHGGEATNGSLDEGLRHAITKLAGLHFTASELYRRRVIQMGEHPDDVVCAGALGVDNALRLELLAPGEALKGLDLDPERTFAVVTFHPVTAGDDAGVIEMSQLLGALDDHSDLQVLFTRPNADAGNTAVRVAQDSWLERNAGRAVAVESLGVRRYLSAVRDAALVLGNSSSGIIEAPSLGTPSIDVGERQSGRDRAECVITVAADRVQISNAISWALSEAGQSTASGCHNPYGTGNAAQSIADRLEPWMEGLPDSAVRRPFYDVAGDLDGGIG